MAEAELNRRDFNKLTLAAFGGIVAGTMAGCAGKEEEDAPADEEATESADEKATTTTPEEEGESAALDPSLLAEELHVCRGLNSCQNKGTSGENACAGQGTCATAEHHSCHGMNECKGQGGCEESAGQNACKGKGACEVPLGEETWTKVRALFEEQMEAAGTEVGAAPAAG